MRERHQGEHRFLPSRSKWPRQLVRRSVCLSPFQATSSCVRVFVSVYEYLCACVRAPTGLSCSLSGTVHANKANCILFFPHRWKIPFDLYLRRRRAVAAVSQACLPTDRATVGGTAAQRGTGGEEIPSERPSAKLTSFASTKYQRSHLADQLLTQPQLSPSSCGRRRWRRQRRRCPSSPQGRFADCNGKTSLR